MNSLQRLSSYKFTILVKVLLRSIVMITITLALVEFISYKLSSDQIIRLTQQQERTLTETYAERFDQQVKNIYADLELLKQLPAFKNYHKNRLFSMIEEAEAHKKDITLFFINLAKRESNYLLIRFIDKSGQEIIKILNRQAQEPFYAPSQKTMIEQIEWGNEPMDRGVHYIKELEQESMVFLQPIFVSDEFIGYVEVNSSLAFLVNKLRQEKLFETGYLSVLSKEGRVIYHPNYPFGTNLAAELPQFITIIQEMEQQQKGNLQWTLEQTYEVGFSSLQLKDWFIVAFAPENEMLATLITIRNIVIAIVCATILFELVFLMIFIRGIITRPIRKLLRTTEDIIAGNLESEIDPGKNDEIGDLAKSFSNMRDTVRQNLSELKYLNEHLEQLVEERTHKLEEALHQLEEQHQQLKQTQTQLIQSEKMAALGQLIAGIAHEINTPLGVIRASIGNVSDALRESFINFPKLFQTLEGEQLETFLDLLRKGQQNQDDHSRSLSAREERRYKQSLIVELEAHHIENTDVIANTLVYIGIYENINPFLSLFKSDASLIMRSAYNLSSLQNNSQRIDLAVERASKVVFALKKFSHHDQAGEMISSDIIDGIETVLTLYQNQFKQGIEIVKHYQELPPVLCYPDELNQVWTNLLHNALQAMNYQGRIEIGVQQKNSHVVVEITDNGDGISTEIQDRIFDPFFTTKAAGEGSGLGLDICKKIIEKHQGMIEVKSVTGRTTFSVSIPITH